MNKNLISPILIILAIGTFFTFTRGRIDELKTISASNANYLQAIKNSEDLIKTRDTVLADYNSLSANDKDRLNKMIPDNIDNVRLIIDINNIGSRHGIALNGVTTSAGNSSGPATPPVAPAAPTLTPPGSVPIPISVSTPTYGIVTVSFSFSSSYDNGISLLNDIQSSLRILDISSLTVTAANSAANSTASSYNFSVQLQTYWLKQ